MATDQQLDIRVHGQPQTQSPVHGGLLPPHGGKGGPGIGPVHGAAASPGFTPLSLSNLIVWLDPSDPTARFQDTAGSVPATADGQNLKRLKNLGTGANFTEGTVWPLYKTDGTLHWALFDGVNDRILSVATIDLTAYSVVGIAALFKPLNATSGIVCELSGTVNSNNNAFYMAQNLSVAGKIQMGMSVSAAVDNVETTSNAFGTGVMSMIIADMVITQAAAQSKMPLERNGAAVAMTTGADTAGAGVAFGNYNLHIGARSATSLFANMELYGLLMRGGGFGADKANVAAWLAPKGGLVI